MISLTHDNKKCFCGKKATYSQKIVGGSFHNQVRPICTEHLETKSIFKNATHDKEAMWLIDENQFEDTVVLTDRVRIRKILLPKSAYDQIRRDAKKEAYSELLNELEKLFFAVNDKGINGQRRLYEQHLVEFRAKTLGEQVKKE